MGRSSGFNVVDRWLALVAAPAPRVGASFVEREQARRGRLVGGLLLALALIELGALFQFVVVDDDHPVMVRALLITLVLTVVAGFLNRLGHVGWSGLLLVALADLPLVSIPATAVGGQFDIVDLGALYLLAGSLLVAASALAPWSVFVVAVINGALIVALIALMPHTSAFALLIASNNAQQALAGPLLMQAVVALVAFFWAQSVLTALKRADRAEEIAELERREAERTHELEQGVRDLLDVHVQLANGNFHARSQGIRSPQLWQIGNSLNTLAARLARLGQADAIMRHAEQNARQLADAIRAKRAGLQPNWPAPSGTPLDSVIAALTDIAEAPPSPPPVTRESLEPWPFERGQRP
ncbi:MAG TPA: hypothetical protein VF792_06415 [Ktedonobacterales bacterium]